MLFCQQASHRIIAPTRLLLLLMLLMLLMLLLTNTAPLFVLRFEAYCSKRFEWL